MENNTKTQSIYTEIPDALLGEVLSLCNHDLLWNVFMDNIEPESLMAILGDNSIPYIEMALRERDDAQERLKEAGLPFIFQNIDYEVLGRSLVSHYQSKLLSAQSSKKIIISLPDKDYWYQFVKKIVQEAYFKFNNKFGFLWLVSETYHEKNLKSVLGYADINTRLRFLECYNTTYNYISFCQSYYYRSLIETIMDNIKSHILTANGTHGYNPSGWPIWSEYEGISIDNDYENKTFPAGLVYHSNGTEWKDI